MKQNNDSVSIGMNDDGEEILVSKKLLHLANKANLTINQLIIIADLWEDPPESEFKNMLISLYPYMIDGEESSGMECVVCGSSTIEFQPENQMRHKKGCIVQKIKKLTRGDFCEK